METILDWIFWIRVIPVGIFWVVIILGLNFPCTIHNNKCNKFGKIPKVPDNKKNKTVTIM